MHKLSVNPSDAIEQYNFADAIYQIFKSKQQTSLKYDILSRAFSKLYGTTLKTKEASNLPFIKFGTNLNDHNMVYLVIEIDDICDGCKSRHCQLLHSLSPDDEFKTANQNGKVQSTIISIPNICLLDRIHEIFKSIDTYPKAMSITELKRIHNDKYPQFMSHQPTLHNIMQRFKAEFSTEYDAKEQDQMIISKEVETEQEIILPVDEEEDEKIDDSLPINPDEWFLERDSADQRQIQNLKNLQKSISPLRSPNKKGMRAPLPPEFEKDIFQSFEISRKSMDRINNHWQRKVPNKSPSRKIVPNNTAEMIVPKSDVLYQAYKDTHIVSDFPLLIIPEQLNKFYLSTELSEEWKDKELIDHFLRHIRRHSGILTSDVYLANRRRVGFFTAAHPTIAEAFVRKVKEKEVKCWGRTVEAEIVRLRKQKRTKRAPKVRQPLKSEGCRVKIKNVNCAMQHHDFKEWVYWITKSRGGLISDIELLYPRKQKGTTQCICVFEYKNEADDVLYSLRNVPFRGVVLRWKRWSHGEHKELIRLKIDAMKERQREADELAKQKEAEQKQAIQAINDEDYAEIEYANSGNDNANLENWITTEVQDMSIRRNSKNKYVPNNTSLHFAMYNQNRQNRY